MATSTQAGPVNRWLFSPAVDLSAFLGSAVFSLVLLAVGVRLGLIHQDTPDWTWVTAVLLIDVAHVWSTAFIVYFDPQELRRRVALYSLVPLLAFTLGVVLYVSGGETMFWRCLAYLAVFHFVRQQWGWVAMYRGRLRERDRVSLWLDRFAIYLATIYPLIYWHAHLTTAQFNWFRSGDFARDKWIFDLPAFFTTLEQIVRPLYWLVLAAYFSRSIYQWRNGRANPGKDIVVLTTAVCWYVGIVAFNSDYAFTVTNVVIHGIPYFVLVFVYWRAKHAHRGEKLSSAWRMALVFMATLWFLAYVEELFWHRGQWHDKEWLFGEGWNLDLVEVGPITLPALLVPLLAVPQVTHYILDGFIWRRKSNPDLALLSGQK
jgi:hypothetical protein